jgi:hypothetical protein
MTLTFTVPRWLSGIQIVGTLYSHRRNTHLLSRRGAPDDTLPAIWRPGDLSPRKPGSIHAGESEMTTRPSQLRSWMRRVVPVSGKGAFRHRGGDRLTFTVGRRLLFRFCRIGTRGSLAASRQPRRTRAKHLSLDGDFGCYIAGLRAKKLHNRGRLAPSTSSRALTGSRDRCQ